MDHFLADIEMSIKGVSEASPRGSIKGLSQGLLPEKDISGEYRIGLVYGFGTFNSQLTLHTDEFVEVSEDNRSELFPNMGMIIFGDEDFFIGDFELGHELLVVQRLVNPMVLFDQN